MTRSKPKSPKPVLLTFQDLVTLSFANPTGSTRINPVFLQNVLVTIGKKMNLTCTKFELSGIEADEIDDLVKNHSKPHITVKECLCQQSVPEEEEQDNVDSQKSLDEEQFNSAHSCAEDLHMQMLELNVKVENLQDELKVQNENMKNRLAKACNTDNLNIFDLYKDETYELKDDGEFSSECEDLCDPCEPCNENVCNLLKNRDFLKKLMRKTTSPVVDRIFQFEDRIRLLSENFTRFLEAADREYKKIPMVEEALFAIGSLKNEFRKHVNDFMVSMEEIQEMLDSKVDKVHIPPLKKWIQNEIETLRQEILQLKEIKDCPKALGTVLTNVQCLSCMNKVCTKAGTQMMGLFAEATASKNPNDVKTRGRVCFLCCMDRIPGKDYKDLGPEEVKSEDRIEYIQGDDGNMYRKGVAGRKTCKMF